MPQARPALEADELCVASSSHSSDMFSASSVLLEEPPLPQQQWASDPLLCFLGSRMGSSGRTGSHADDGPPSGASSSLLEQQRREELLERKASATAQPPAA